MTKVMKLMGFIIVLTVGIYAAFSKPVAAAAIVVDSAADTVANDGDCTLREAIVSATNDASADCTAGTAGLDTITFGMTDTIILNSALNISTDVTIDGGNRIVLDGNDASRIFAVMSGTVTIENLTMQNGSGNGGGAVWITSTQSVLNLDNVVIDQNSARVAFGSDGGAIAMYNGATVNIANSSITRNRASDDGGGIYNEGGRLSVQNSTISGNRGGTADFNRGGGILGSDAARTSLNFVTISDNSSGTGGGLAYPGNPAGGAYTVTNSIVYGNQNLSSVALGTLDCESSISFTVAFSDYNIWGTGCENLNSGSNDVYLAPGQTVVGALGFYTGTTEIMPLFSSSPAVDAADPAGCLATDQVGTPRPAGLCDIGAAERVAGSELLLTKEANLAEVLPGDLLTYTITVSNGGEVTATNVTVEDSLPAQFSNPVVTSSVVITEISGAPNYEWELPDLAAGEAVVIEIGGMVASNIPAQMITNTATITGTADFIVRDAHDAYVTVLNAAPVANDDTPSAVAEDTVLTINVLANDSDANNDPLTITAVGSPTNGEATTDGSTITYTPTLDYVGQDVFTYTVSDNQGGSDSATVTVMFTAVNDAPYFTTTPPMIALVDALYSYTAVAVDPDVSDVFTITQNVLPSWLNFTDNGDGTVTISGTPTVAHVGTHAVELVVTDNEGLTSTQSFNINVTDGSNPPTFVSTPVTNGVVGQPYSYMVEATDLDSGDVLTITADTLPSWLTLTDNGDGTASLTGTPGSANVGSHNVVLRVTDSFGASDLQSFTITVTNNPAPTFTSSPVTQAMANSLYTYHITTSDNMGDSVTISGTYPSWLTLTDNGDGTADLTGTPTDADVGSTLIQIDVTDSLGQTTTQSYTLTVLADKIFIFLPTLRK